MSRFLFEAFLRAQDANGDPVSGARLYVYEAGTTTPVTTYSDSALSVAHASPVVADSAGYFPQVYVPAGAYKVRVTDASDVVLDEHDNVDQAFLATADGVGGVDYSDVAALLADNATYPAGTILRTREEGFAYEAVDSGGHIRMASGAGQRLNALPDADGALNAGAVCQTGTANNAPALDALYASSPAAIRFDDFYPVTGNFRRTNIPHYGPGGVVIGGTNIPLSTERVDADVTVYDATTGSDTANHGLTSGQPFATIGRALQSCPAVLGRGVTYLVEVADGTYTTSAVAAGDMPRPALIYLSSVKSDRSAASGSDLIGGVVVRGASKSGTIIRAGSTYTYGAYATQATNLALQDLTLDTAAACQALITGHRASYIQTLNVDVTGSTNAANCIVAEAGGVVECTGNGAISGATTGVAAFDESLIVLSNTGTLSGASGSQIGGRGTIQISNTFAVSGAVTAEGATIILRGTDASNRVAWSSTTTLRFCNFTATFANISGQVVANHSRVDINASGFSNALFIRGGSLLLRGSATSYIAPATASTVANPVVLQADAQYIAETGTAIVGSGGADEALRQQSSQAITGNDQTVTLDSVQGRCQTKQLTSDGAHTGLVIATAYADNSLPPCRGDRVTLHFSGANSVALATSGIDIAGTLTLGQGAGQVQAVTLEWFGAAWAEVGRSGAN